MHIGVCKLSSWNTWRYALSICRSRLLPNWATGGKRERRDLNPQVFSFARCDVIRLHHALKTERTGFEPATCINCPFPLSRRMLLTTQPPLQNESGVLFKLRSLLLQLHPTIANGSSWIWTSELRRGWFYRPPLLTWLSHRPKFNYFGCKDFGFWIDGMLAIELFHYFKSCFLYPK